MMETIMPYLSVLMVILLLVYAHRILFFYRGLSRLYPGSNRQQPDVCVIVPARNEEKTIGRCLRSLIAQRYPRGLLTVIVVDDHSTDRTANEARVIADASAVPVMIVPVTEYNEIASPKIRALAHGIQHTPATIVMTTDADCTAPPDWIASTVAEFADTVGVVTGVTVFEKPEHVSPLFWGIQFLDFISYTSIAAGAIGMGKTLIANGSNMAFRREAFDDSGGFAPFMHINTGDDSLLAQNIVARGKWRSQFSVRHDVAVSTQPARTWKEFMHQRLRWVGQTAYYPPFMMFFMISTFLLFIVLTVTLPYTLADWNIIPWCVLTGKFSIDYLMMKRFTALTGTESIMKYFIPTAAIHIPYILAATIGGYFFSFEWKNRSLKKEAGQ